MHKSFVTGSRPATNAHAAAVYVSLTGHDRGEQGGGTKPTDNPTLGQSIATLYQALGIDYRRQLLDSLQRPHHIVPVGDVVPELLTA